MLTPADIESKEFKKSHRGYDEQEVDEFLDQIILDFEQLIKENKSLKEQLNKPLPKEETKDSKTEKSVYETLEAAKALMNDIALSSERRAEVLLKNAELEAEMITKEAKQSIKKYSDEGERLKQRVDSLRDRYKKMLESELERLDYFTEDFIKDFEKDFYEKKKNTKVSVEKITTETANIDLSKTMVMPKIGK